MPEESREPQMGLPEDGDNFKRWQERYEQDPEAATRPAPGGNQFLDTEVMATLPENSEAFKRWQERQEETPQDRPTEQDPQ